MVLRVKIATKAPRDDAAVSIWLSEADGSWYYLKDAIPLIDAENGGDALFTDFTEAEWISPGSHG